MEYGANYLHSKASKLSEMWREMKTQTGTMINLCHEIEDKAEESDRAYAHGYTDAESEYREKLDKIREESYKKGLSDAWEAAKKIVCYEIDGGYPIPQMLDLFNRDDLPKILSDYTSSEAIEKIRQYEQEQEGFHVGDEFENESGKKFVVLKMNGKEIDRYIDVDGKTYCMTVKYKEMRKTGRHFQEIAAVFEKMREES